MATSSSVNFTMTRNQIVTDALMMIGALGEEEAIDNSTLEIADRQLNRLIKHFENQALHIWKRTEAVVFLQQGQRTYTLGSGSTDHATETVNTTTISAGMALGATVISVSSNSGININDYIGIILDNGSLQWSTVTATATGTVTISNALTGSAALGNYIFTYTTNINKPLDVYQVRNYNFSSKNEYEIKKTSYEEYQALSNKDVQGSNPNQWVYSRQRTTGQLLIYPPPQNVITYARITYAKPLEDLDNPQDESDVPVEWLDYLVAKLALRLAPTYGKIGSNAYAQLQGNVKEMENEVLAFDNEKSSVKLQPAKRY